MMSPMHPSLDYYREPGEITRICKHQEAIRGLTDDVRALCQSIQGILIHDAWIGRYGGVWRAEQTCGVNLAYMEDILDKAKELEDRNFAIARSPEKRVIGCCREFATLLCAILRHKGVAARSRCGFATYLAWPGCFEDHWICEYWSADEGRWIGVDAQIDAFQQSFLSREFELADAPAWMKVEPRVGRVRGLPEKFNPLDISGTDFVTAGAAWRKCRSGEWESERFGIGCDPKIFGVETLYGLWFIRGNLLRDFAALNKVEVEPYLLRMGGNRSWKNWRLVSASDEELSAEDYALLDRISELSIDPDESIGEIQRTYQMQTELQPARDIVARVL